MIETTRRAFPFAGLLAAGFTLLAVPARAQSTATLQGTVTDAQSAAVPGAAVSVKNVFTGVQRDVVTDNHGDYQVAALPVGLYRVEVSAPGFQTQVASEVRLEVARTVVQNFRLKLGGVAEEMTVTAEAPVIETATSSVGQVINQRTVQEIPLNGRHFVDLGLLIPGSVTPPQSGFLTAPLRGQGSFAFNTAGNREDTVNFMINGVNLNDMVQNQITFQPSINTVQEFKVDNQTFSAEYGRNSGAIVNIATRSGTNAFHGEAFEFLRNERFDARNFFNQPPAGKSRFTRNQFGANLGGPVSQNKTFFFLSYEGLRQRQGIDINSPVLRADERAAVTDAVSRRLLALIPEPNTVGSRGEGRFVGSATAPVNIDQWTGDLNHLFGASDTLHAYYAFQKDLRGEPVLQGNTIPGFGDTRQSHRQIGTLNETHIFGQGLVNEARFGFNRIHITFSPNAQLNPTDYGMNVGTTTALALPQITVNGLGLNFGGPSGFPQGRTDTTMVLSDTVSYLRGRHSFRLGGEWRRFENSNFNSDPGDFRFASLADFQAGRGNSFAITLGDRPSDIVQQAFGLFVQDSFKAASNLTLDLGLRFDRLMAPTDTQDRFVLFDAATASLVRVGSGRDSVYKTENALEPRVGIVWDPFQDGKTSVRAAYALLRDQPVTNMVTPTSANPPLAVPLTFAGLIRLDSAVTTARAAGLSPASVAPDFQPPRLQTWNVNVQRQIGRNLGVMVGYFGSRGDDLRVSRNINQFVNGVRPFPALSASSPIQPGSALGNITEIGSLGYSRYKGLWITANQRLAKGLQFNASYTLSKSNDTNSLNSQATILQDSFNVADNYGPSDYDVRHRFVMNAIYELPFKGSRFTEGWQIGVITQLQTGNPISIVTALNTFTGVNNALRPDLVGDPRIIGSPNQWFDNTVCDPRISGSCTSSSVFALPVSPAGAFHFGNLGRNAIYGPGFANTDLSIIKNTKINGTTRLQLRVEAFDVFNHANLGQPGRIAAVGSTAFGVITNTRFPTGDSGSARQIQFAVKLLF
jgi:hypothetical protein